MTDITIDSEAPVLDVLTRRRMDAQEWDYSLDIKIRGVNIGDTGRVRWLITQAVDKNGDYEKHDEQYIADVLEKVVRVIRQNNPESQGPCETTLTERWQVDYCICETYPANLGPCKTYLPGGQAKGQCVYCDHEQRCHLKLEKMMSESKPDMKTPQDFHQRIDEFVSMLVQEGYSVEGYGLSWNTRKPEQDGSLGELKLSVKFPMEKPNHK